MARKSEFLLGGLVLAVVAASALSSMTDLGGTLLSLLQAEEPTASRQVVSTTGQQASRELSSQPRASSDAGPAPTAPVERRDGVASAPLPEPTRTPGADEAPAAPPPARTALTSSPVPVPPPAADEPSRPMYSEWGSGKPALDPMLAKPVLIPTSGKMPSPAASRPGGTSARIKTVALARMCN